MLSDWVTIGLTGVLVGATVWYAWTTRKALGASREANEKARQGMEEARLANALTARAFFGAELVVTKTGENVFLFENIAQGPARNVCAHFQIAEPPSRREPDSWRPLGDPPQAIGDGTIPGRGQDASPHATHMHYRDQHLLLPPGYQWPSPKAPQDEQPGAVYARVRASYSDALRTHAEAFSTPFVLIRDRPLDG